MRIPEQAVGIMKVLTDAGFEAYVVGGCVRDTLLHREPEDWDITTDASPAEVKRLFRRTVDTGIAHGTVTVMVGEKGYEVTTYRIDGDYEDARHPKEVIYTKSLEEDLRRRDFTINAMAYNDRVGLVDLFGGLDDLREKKIRCVGDPVERFREDALRILRAMRFSAQLDAEIEDKTFQALREAAPTLKKISAERIFSELTKLIRSPHPEKLLLAYEAGVTAVILPEFDRCMKTPQHTPWHLAGVGEHTVKSMQAIRPDRILRLTMLMHDFGKPFTRTTDAKGVDHFYGHAEVSAELAESVLMRMKCDHKTIRRVCNLIYFHDAGVREKLDQRAVRKLAAKVGREDFPLLLEVKAADNAAKSPYMREENQEQIRKCADLFEEILREQDALTLHELRVSGKDLIAAGMRPGPEVGKTLEAMLADVIECPEHNTKEYLLEEGRFI